jgi:hypothetical protein
MTELKEISVDHKPHVGDVIQFKFAWGMKNLWLRSAQVAAFENALRLKPEFELLSSNYNDPDFYIIKIRIKPAAEEPGFLTKLSVGVLAAGIVQVAALLLLKITLEKAWLVIEKMAEVATDAARFVAGNYKPILAAVAVIAGLILWSKFK